MQSDLCGSVFAAVVSAHDHGSGGVVLALRAMQLWSSCDRAGRLCSPNSVPSLIRVLLTRGDGLSSRHWVDPEKFQGLDGS